MVDKKSLLTHFLAFATGAFIGKKTLDFQKKVEFQDQLNKLIKTLALSSGESEFVRESLADPEVLLDFIHEGRQNPIDSKLAKRAKQKIYKIITTHKRYGEFLRQHNSTIMQTRRINNFNEFIVNHSKSEIVEILASIEGKYGDLEKLNGEGWEALTEALDHEWSLTELKSYACFKIIAPHVMR